MLKKTAVRQVAATLIGAMAAALATFCALRGVAAPAMLQLSLCVGAALLGAGAGFVTMRTDTSAVKPEKLFLMLFIPLSLAMMIALPIGRVPDEDSHLQRIWLLSEGQFASGTQSRLSEPAGLLEGISDETTTHATLSQYRADTISQERVTSDAGFNTGVYPPVSYLPQALMTALVRLFTQNRIVLLYAARFGGWLATLLLLYTAIRLLPAGKYTLIAVTLMPIALQEEMSASVDGMAIGAVALLTAWMLRLRTDGTQLKPRHVVLMTLLCLLTASCKMIYIPFLLMPLILPAVQWGSMRRKILSLSAIWGTVLAVAVLWLGICYTGYVAGQTLQDGATGVGTIMPQLRSMMSHPLSFLWTALRTCFSQAVIWIHTMLGSALSALNVPMPLWLLVLEAIALAAVWLLDHPLEEHVITAPRVLPVTASILSVFVMLAALYCWWNPYQSAVIEGMQGRYFLPMLMPLLLAFSFRKRLNGRFVSSSILLMAVVSVAVIARTALLCM